MSEDIFGDEQEPAQPESEAQPEAPQEEPEKVVPMNALNEARMNERQMRNELNQVKQQLGQYEALKQQLEEYRQQQAQEQYQQQQKETHDKFESDPLGTLRDELQSLKEQQAQATQYQAATYQQQLEQQQAQQYKQQVEQQVAQQAQEFAKQNSDYGDALNYLVQSRASELSRMGYDQNSINQVIEQEAYQLSANAIQSGMNPAEIIYDMAKDRGYAAKAVQKSVEKIEKGQQASQSLAGTQGHDEGVGLQDIAKMSDDEFDKLWSEMERENRQ